MTIIDSEGFEIGDESVWDTLMEHTDYNLLDKQFPQGIRKIRFGNMEVEILSFMQFDKDGVYFFVNVDLPDKKKTYRIMITDEGKIKTKLLDFGGTK